MVENDDLGVLVLRVWRQEGTPVARLLGNGVDDLGAHAGGDEILGAVARWLGTANTPCRDENAEGANRG